MPEERIDKKAALSRAVECLLMVEGINLATDEFQSHVQLSQAWALIAQTMSPTDYVSWNPETFVKYKSRLTS